LEETGGIMNQAQYLIAGITFDVTSKNQGLPTWGGSWDRLWNANINGIIQKNHEKRALAKKARKYVEAMLTRNHSQSSTFPSS
jgi:hypothetical protein